MHHRLWNRWISTQGRFGSARRPVLAATRSFPRFLSSAKSASAISWLRGDIAGQTMMEEGEDRKALPRFLLQGNSVTGSLENGPEPKDPQRRMLLEHVHFNQQPVVDSYWMPEPLLYQTMLSLPRGYLQSLEEFQQKVETPFRTRLLLLQSFVHESALAETNKELLESKRTLLSQERLIAYGETQLRYALMYYFYHRFPTANPKAVRSYLQLLPSNDPLLNTIAASTHRMGSLILCSPAYREIPETGANTLRAFVGALWLDQGTNTSLQFLHRHVIPKIAVKVESKMKE